MLVQWIKHSAENITVKLDQTHLKKGVDFGMYPLGKKKSAFYNSYVLCVSKSLYSVYYGSIEMAVLLCMYILPYIHILLHKQ